MRWLGILAIVIVGLAIYLRSVLSDGSPTPKRDRPAQEVPVEVERRSDDKPVVATKPPVEVRPVVPKREPVPVAPTMPSDRPTVAPPEPLATPADASEEEVPWTEQERWQKLWAISGRYEKGNYPGAVELAHEVARRYPPWQEDAWKYAVQAHCAMNEPDKASALFAKMTDKGAIEEITKSCTAWNVKLESK
jgi:hypothetical protein